jgi:hypothetical protein
LIQKRYQAYQKLDQFEGGRMRLSQAHLEVRLGHFDQKVDLSEKSHLILKLENFESFDEHIYFVKIFVLKVNFLSRQ